MLMPIETSYGTLYIEDLNEKREEKDRVKLYDSTQKYLDYFDVEFLQHCAKLIGKSQNKILDDAINEIKKCNSVIELCNYLFIKYFLITTSIIEVASNLNAICGVDDYHSESDILENEWVNKIGNTYIIIDE